MRDRDHTGSGTGIHPEWNKAVMDKLESAYEKGTKLTESKIATLVDDLKSDKRFRKQFAKSLDAPMSYWQWGNSKGNFTEKSKGYKAVDKTLKQLASLVEQGADETRFTKVRRHFKKSLISIGGPALMGYGAYSELSALQTVYSFLQRNKGKLTPAQIHELSVDIVIGNKKKGITGTGNVGMGYAINAAAASQNPNIQQSTPQKILNALTNFLVSPNPFGSSKPKTPAPTPRKIPTK